MKRILGMFFLALALGGAIAVALPAGQALGGAAQGTNANTPP